MRILITGGAGFVGGALARSFLEEGGRHQVVLFDNLHRRGSEWNLAGLLARGATFVHGDVRSPADLAALEGSFDALLEASAEPSVHAGSGDSPRYVLDTNLGGALNCLELARERCGGVVFLSTSRVYSLAPLRELALVEGTTRFELVEGSRSLPGVGAEGISERFPTDGPRSYYGASKLAAELLCQEYAAHAGLRVVIDRCGVIAGPGQFGRTDQGVFTLWVARHLSGRPLAFTGFGGRGLQVRDLLHPADLVALVRSQLDDLGAVSGKTFNVGGGSANAVSLLEFTRLCQAACGREVPITAQPETNPLDVPWYVSDHRRVTAEVGWSPRRPVQAIVDDTRDWIRANESALAGLIV